MHLSITCGGLRYKNLSKPIENKYQAYKLLGPCVQLVVTSESLCVKHIVVSVLCGRSIVCIVCSMYFCV